MPQLWENFNEESIVVELHLQKWSQSLKTVLQATQWHGAGYYVAQEEKDMYKISFCSFFIFRKKFSFNQEDFFFVDF